MLAGIKTLLPTLGENPQARGRAFECLCRWYLENDPVYRTQLRKVWLWKDSRQDVGALTPASTWSPKATMASYGPFRPKPTARTTPVTGNQRDVDTFPFSSRQSQFSYRLLLATTDRIGKTARRTLDAQEKQAGLRLRANIERAGGRVSPCLSKTCRSHV